MTQIAKTSADVKTFSLQFDELIIDPDEALTILGYASEDIPAQVRHDLDDVINSAKDYCDIHGGIRLFDELQLSQQYLILGNVKFAAGKIICKKLRHADAAALFVCTIGAGLENRSRKLMADGDFLKGYIVDAVASIAVDAAMDVIHSRISDLVPEKQTSNRYSPGYCGWDVAEQQKLFSLLPANFCGVSLSPSSLMTPIKSISGIIGLGDNIKKVDYTCRFCDMKDCMYRRRQEN